jgi:hypothetical protein
MLQLAGFDTPPVIELPFAERVRARHCDCDATGCVGRRSASYGASRPTPRAYYMHAHDCEGRGEPILTSGVARCRRCPAVNRSRSGQPFSDQEITAAIRAWARRRLGPSPHSATIIGRFDSWNQALQASGLTPPRVRRGWSDPDVLDGLRRIAADHGRAPRADDRVGSLSTYPSPR